MAVRKNYFCSVVTGPYHLMGGVSTDALGHRRAGSSLTSSGTIATFTTANNSPHGFSMGQAVSVQGAIPDIYNGTFAVLSVLSPTSFTYDMGSTAASPATGSPTYAALWQVGRTVVEDNIIELVLTPTVFGAPIAIDLYDSLSGLHGSQSAFQQVIIRRNVIRHVDNASDPTQYPICVHLDSTANAIVEDNIINLDTAIPVQHLTVGQVKYFDNQTPSGKLIQGYKVPAPSQLVNELTTDTDSALSFST